MPTLEHLQQRLEHFREAGQNLQLDPLVTRKALARFGVEYQAELVDELEQAVEDCSEQDNKLIFTGHRGCGKSTLLAELGFRLTETSRYFVVMFSIEEIEPSAVDYVNILFSMAVQLLEAAERRSVNLSPELKKSLYRWLAKETHTESQSVVRELEANAGATVKGGLPGVLEFLAGIKSKFKVDSAFRKQITTEFERRIADLISKINEIKAYIEIATKQTILVIIDGIDKLELSVTETVFGKNIQSLLGPTFCIIYTLPIATLRDVQLKRYIEGFVKKIHTMRVAKFFTKATVRDRNRIPDAATMQILRDILDRQLPDDLIEPGIKSQIILKSGGVMRELIRIADLCCDKCMQELRRQIRKSLFDQPNVTINQAILDRVLTDLQISFAEPLGRVDDDLLKFIYDEFEPQDAENRRFLALLHGLYVLEYRNAMQWYDLNPIVVDLLVQKGVIDP